MANTQSRCAMLIFVCVSLALVLLCLCFFLSSASSECTHCSGGITQIDNGCVCYRVAGHPKRYISHAALSHAGSSSSSSNLLSCFPVFSVCDIPTSHASCRRKRLRDSYVSALQASPRGTSLMQPSHTLAAAAAVPGSDAAGSKSDISVLGNEVFAALAEADVSSDQLFFHR